MDFVVWLAFGAFVGWVASILMKTDAQQGWMMNIVLGILGAFVGGLLANMLGFQGVGGVNLYSFVVALMGASLLIWLGKRFV